jgi:mevalonate kinase
MASETVIHGKPSGLDHTVSLCGGFGIFTRADGLRPVAAAPLKVVIGHTGKTRDTKGRVARVAELVTERSDEVRARFAAIASLVERGADAVTRGSYGELGAAMNENQRHLEALEVSCPEIERLCGLARDAGAVGAKLTGGGGGGCVIAVAPAREPAVVAAWKQHGFDAFVAEVRP